MEINKNNLNTENVYSNLYSNYAYNFNTDNLSNESIFYNNTDNTDNNNINYETLDEFDTECIKKELERYIDKLKSDLECTKNSRGFLTSFTNSVSELFGMGDKAEKTKIENYEKLIDELEQNPQNILNVYEEVVGEKLTNNALTSLKTSANSAKSLDINSQNAIILELENQVSEIEKNFETAKKSNGWISGAWDAIKNATGIGASANKTQTEIDYLKEQIELLKNGKSNLENVYKNITGNDFTIDEIDSLLNKENTLSNLTKAGKAVDNYSEGQKMAVDTVADITSGIASVCIVAACSAVGICATPFTAGASLGMVAAGFGIAAGVGAGVKVALKASDCIGNDKSYSFTDGAYDLLTGSANGAMGIFSNGLGATAGKAIMKQAGMEALETTAKRTFGQLAVSAGSKAADMAIDGALSGATDALTRDIGENLFYGEDHEINEIISDTAVGLAGGTIASPIIGGGMIGAEKLGSFIGSEISESVVGKAIEEVGENLSDSISNSTTREIKESLYENFYKFSNEITDQKARNLLNLWGKVEIGDELIDADFVAKLVDGVDVQYQEEVLANFIKLRNNGFELGDEIINLSKSDYKNKIAKQTDIPEDIPNIIETPVEKDTEIVSERQDNKTQIDDLAKTNEENLTIDKPEITDENSAIAPEKIETNDTINDTIIIDSNKKYLTENKHIKTLLEDGNLSEDKIIAMAELDESKFAQLKYLLENENLMESVEQFDFIDSFFSSNNNKGIKLDELIELALLDENSFNKLSALLENDTINLLVKKGQINGKDFIELCKLDDLELNQLNDLLTNDSFKSLINSKKSIFAFGAKKETTNINLRELAKLGEDKLNKLNRLLNNDGLRTLIEKNKLNYDNLIELVNFSDDKFNQLNIVINEDSIKTLIQKQGALKRKVFGAQPKDKINYGNIIELAKLDESKFNQVISLFENNNFKLLTEYANITTDDLSKIVQFDDTYLEQFIALFQNKKIGDVIQNNKINLNEWFNLVQIDNAQFNRINSLIQNKSDILNTDNLEDLLKLYMNLNYYQANKTSLTFKDKVKLLTEINRTKNVIEIDGLFAPEELNNLNAIIDSASDSLKHTITPTNVTADDVRTMMKGFFANNNRTLDNILSTADYTQFGKSGLPLSYPRASFLEDLSKVLKGVSQEEQELITNKLNISLIQDELGNITGYDGIIDLSKLSDCGIEGDVLSLANKFIKENSIITGNEELDNALNALSKGMPEFINVIGKQQHETQNYSVDVHILTVLKNAIGNPDYQNLSEIDKTCLKFATILHDIAKSEGVVDSVHPEASALFARNIMEKYTFPKEINDRIYELVKNHHWLELFNSGKVDSGYIASLFRHKDDYAIGKIMADSDLKGVSDEFYEKYSNALNPQNQMPILQALENINSTGQMVFTSKIIREDLIPQVEYNGVEYKVIDFTKLTKDTDFTQYGFSPDVDYNSFRLYIHMTDSIEQVKTVDYLSDVANGGFLCASYISLKNCDTYRNRKFGVSLEVENVNIANAAKENQSSGFQKEFDKFSKIITGENQILSPHRQTIPSTIKKELNLTDDEYSELYQLLASKKYLSQIQDGKTYTIGTRSIDGSEIKQAIKKANDELINVGQHNESNVYNPKINAIVAKVNSIEEIPEDFLKFAKEQNLTIYILGNK